MNKAVAIREILESGWGQVRFTKADGTETTLDCTTNIHLIPESAVPKGTGRELPDHLVRVYARCRKGWRSFHADRVLQIDDYDLDLVLSRIIGDK
jgi:hypothetical protein